MTGNFQLQSNMIPQNITLNASQLCQLQQNMPDPGNYAPMGIQPIINLAPTGNIGPYGPVQSFRFGPRYSAVGQPLQPEYTIPVQNYFGSLASPNV